jgi:hypothetical protein
MARIRVTAYECERDLLPPVCAKCGKPAVTRVIRPARYFKENYEVWKPVFAVFSLIFLPALGILALVRLSYRIDVPLPMCEEHRHDYVWRDRVSLRWVLPIWTIVVLIFEILAVIDISGGDPEFCGFFLMGVLIAGVMGVIADTLINFTSVKMQVQIKAIGVWLSNVHPDFVAALVEDRARSRVDDANRRGEDDMRQDYDDELN